MPQKPERSAARLIDAIRSSAPGALKSVGGEKVLNASHVCIIDITHPETPSVVHTGGQEGPITFYVRPAGLGKGSGGELFEAVHPESIDFTAVQTDISQPTSETSLSEASIAHEEQERY